MAHLHAQKTLHRDLKPDNVFLNENLYPSIADLGLAKWTDTSVQSMRTGAPIYIAPEVWRGC
jgi:serine/threonine protein kinase